MSTLRKPRCLTSESLKRIACPKVKLTMQHGRRFPLRLKGAVYISYVRPVILHGSEAWCLKESEMGMLRRTERSMVKAQKDLQIFCSCWV